MDMRGGDVVKDADGGKQQFSDVSEGMQLLQRIRVYSFIIDVSIDSLIQFLRLVFVAPSDGKVDGGRTLAFIISDRLFILPLAEKCISSCSLAICSRHSRTSLDLLCSSDSQYCIFQIATSCVSAAA